MPTIALEGVSFHYENPYNAIFDQLSLSLDTRWKTAIVGRNGKGKTTLLNLIRRTLEPTAGRLAIPVETTYFPHEPPDPSLPVGAVIKQSIAPFAAWEQSLQQLLDAGDQASLERYGALLERYQQAGGYEIDDRIEKEWAQLQMDPALLQRPFNSLSGGERTRALVIALFAQRHAFPLIDEPTNHLDMQGRDLLGRYLARKTGFVLVSHDRHFLDLCADHILALNKGDVRLHQGRFCDWQRQMELEEESEQRQKAKIKREVAQLERAARQRRDWSDHKEKEKIGAADKGAIGHKAAKMMKRALAVEHRIDDKLAEKKELLKNQEKERPLKLAQEGKMPDTLLALDQIHLALEGRTIIRDLSLRLRPGDRLAVLGPNGSGKTTLLNAIEGGLAPVAGTMAKPAYLTLFRAFQTPLWSRGQLRHHLHRAALDETHFRNIMGVMGVEGEVFDRPLETFSEGERKKVDLCRSFLAPHHLLLWDEPLNYLDIHSRQQIEAVVLEYAPSLIFVEHDRYFVDRVATQVIELPAPGKA